MKYKTHLKGYEFLKEEDLLHELLKYRGVENPSRLLNISENDIQDGMLFKNMLKGLKLLKKHIKENSAICIIVDSDFDGYSSSAFIYQYIKNISPNIQITFVIHNKKEHGIKLDELKEISYDLLIVPDAGSGDLKEMKELHRRGKDILILDHHKFKTDSDYAVIINCQDKQYPNNTLAGVGVVYKFCKEFDKKYGYDFADLYLDLVACGMVADDMDLRNYETRYMVLEGLRKLGTNNCNKLLKEICLKNEKRIKEIPTILNVGWNIAPLINAVTRVGTMEEKRNLFKAMIGVEDCVEYQPRRKKKTDPKPPVEIVSLQKDMARQLVNIKSRQDKLVKKGMELLNDKIKNENLDGNKIIFVDGTNDIEQTFTGLVANKISEKYKRPSVILREKDDKHYGGSGRNYDLFEVDNLMKFLLSTETFNSVSGHPNAFGFELKKDNLNKAILIANEKLKDVKLDDIYHVDYAIPIGRLKEKDICQVGRWNNIWGNTLPEPQFAIKNISITSDNIQLIGEKQNLIKIEKQIGSRKITFVKQGGVDEYNLMIGKQIKGLGKRTVKRLNMEIIGTFQVNNFNNNEYPQIKIIDYNIKESKKLEF